jgi:hypothetical protein
MNQEEEITMIGKTGTMLLLFLTLLVGSVSAGTLGGD